MKVLLDWWEMGSFPWLVPYREGEDDVRRTIEVPEDLYERLVDAHEEFCAVLSEVHVQCLEIQDAPAPGPVHLLYGRHYPGGDRYSGGVKVEGYAGRCASCDAEAAVEALRISAEEHTRALREILARGWAERRHGGLACPGCAPHKVLLGKATAPTEEKKESQA